MLEPGASLTTRSAMALPGARTALLLLLSINFFNYVDRQVLAAVETKIEESFFPVSQYPDTPEVQAEIQGKLGSLNLAFMVSYMLAAPLFGFLADRTARWLLVGVGVLLWTVASGASGLAPTFFILFVTRCFVGIGEAAYGPVAPTVIADLYPVKQRGSKLAWFYVAIPVGSAFGYILGGQVSAWTGDWRWAFYVVVPPGVLLGIWCFLMRDPARGQADAVSPPLPKDPIHSPPLTKDPIHSPPLTKGGPGGVMTPAATRQATRKDYLMILKTPSYLLNTLGMTAMTFAMGGIAFWMPRYVLKQKEWGTHGASQHDLRRHRRRGRPKRHAAGRFSRRQATGAFPGLLFFGVGDRHDAGCAIHLARADLPIPVGLDLCFSCVLLSVLQHRADQHDTRQRHSSVGARQRFRASTS